MSNLLKALKRAEQERQQIRQDGAAPPMQRPPQTVGEDATAAHVNPLPGEGAFNLPPGPGTAPPQVSVTALLIVTALAMVLAGNLGYWLRGRGAVAPAPVSASVVSTPSMSGVPLALLAGDAVPMQLRLDRRTSWETAATAR